MSGRKNSNKELVEDVGVLIDQLQDEWSHSKEAVWRVEVPSGIVARCEEELGEIQKELERLEHMEDSELSLRECMEVTKQACVFFRVVEKVMSAARNCEDKKSLVITLDGDEYKLFVSKFLELM